MSGLEEGPLVGAEMECVLELGGFARALDAEEDERGIGGHDRALVRAEKVTRILRREDQRTLVFADAPGQADDQASARRVLEKQAQLLDHQPPGPVTAY